MNPSRPSFLDIANFAGTQGLDTGRVVKSPNSVEEKKVTVADQSMAKKAMFGSEDEQRTIATAVQRGNNLGEVEILQDLQNMSFAGLVQKYGDEVAQNRHRYVQSREALLTLQNQKRTTEDTIQDSLIDFGKMAVNTVGGAAAAGAAGVDMTTGTNLSTGISAGLDWFNQAAGKAQSELMQARREQHALEAELDSQDRQVQLQAEVAENPDSFVPGLKNIGRAFMDTVKNYTDDPIMAGSLVPEGIGSLVPSTAAIKVISKARTLNKLMRAGRSRKDALAFLKTDDGKALLNQEALAAAPLVLGASEAGGSITQTQQEILGMSEDDLMQYEGYKALRDQDMTHEEAAWAFATDKGTESGLLAIPGALVAGKIAAPFAAAPLTTGAKGGFGSSVIGAGRNVASESVEETFQEANSQAASNVALERSVTENLGEAAGEGFVGGIATAGPLQAPGAAVGSLVETGQALASGASTAVNAREESQAAQEDAQSPVGTNARQEASDRAVAAGEALDAAIAESTTETQTEASEEIQEPQRAEPPKTRIDLRDLNEGPVEPRKIAEVTNAANYLTEEEMGAYVPMFPELKSKQDTGGRIRRSDFIEAAGVLMDSEDDIQAANGAMAILDGLNDLQKADSTPIRKALENLPENDPARVANSALRESIETTMSSPVVAKAKAIIRSMTEEGMKALTDIEDLTKPDVSEELRQSAINRTRVVAQHNPGLLDAAGYDAVLNQTKDGRDRKTFKNARRTSTLFNRAQEEKAKITYGSRPTVDIVRDEIERTGNSSNNMPSLTEHYRNVVDAVLTGNTEDGMIALEDLRSFARSQNNKIEAYNASAKDGGKKKSFEAFGPYKFFEQTEYKPFADVTNANSVALAQEAMVDAQSVTGLYNLLRASYGDELGFGEGPLKTPTLDTKIRNAARGFSKTGVTPNQTTPEPKTSEATRRAARPERQLRSDARLKPEESLIDRKEQDQTPQPQTQSVQETRKDAADEQTRVDESEADQERETVASSESPARTESSPESRETSDLGDAVQPEPGREVVEELAEQRSQVDTAETPDPEINHTAAWFKGQGPNLVGGDSNRFLRAFKPTKTGSSLLAHESPAEYIQANSGSLVTDNNGLQVELTAEQQEGMSQLLDNLLPTMSNFFEQTLAEVSEQKNWMGLLEKDGSPVLRYKPAMPLNFMVRDDENPEQLKFDERVLQATMMGSIEWLIEAQSKGRPTLDDEGVAKKLGLKRGTFITPAMQAAAQSGERLQMVLREISGRIQTLMGVQAKTDVPSNLTQGMFMGLASNALRAMIDADVLKLNEHEIADQGQSKTIMTFRPNYSVSDPESENGKALVSMRGVSNVFSQIFTESRDKVRYIGAAPQSVSPTIIRNSMAPLSETETKVIQKLQQVPYQVNQTMMNLVEMLGDGTFLNLLGYQDTSQGTFNKNHLESVEGKNTALISGLNGFRGYQTEAEVYAETAGIDITEVPIFFDYKFSSVGRLQQVGPVTPQGDKVMRELVTVTNSVIDISDPASEKTDDLWLAVAQSLDVSIDKLAPEDAIAKAKSLVSSNGAFGPVLQILKDGLINEEIPAEAQKRLQEALKDSGEPVTMKTLHALQTVARMELAREQDDADTLAQFATSLAMEADGVTDGPINALVHMYTGEVNDWYLDTLAKGGWFLKGDTRTRNEQVAKDKNDLYHSGAKIFDRNLAERLSDMPAEEAAHAMKVYTVLDRLLTDFNIGYDEDGNLSFNTGRGEVKNPLTVMIYGSSVGGVANKISSAVLDKLYETLSEIVQSGKPWQEHPLFAENPELATQLDDLMNTRYDEGVIKSTSQGFGSEILAQPKESGFTAETFANLSSHIETFFAEPMFQALDEATGGVTRNMETAQKASQVQYLVFVEKFNKALEKRRQELTKAGVLEGRTNEKTGTVTPVEMLPEDEMKKVFAEVSKFAPIYETDVHEFHISAKETFNSDEVISEDFRGGFAGASVTPSPSEPSVKVSPYMTIGTGDGRMILNIYANGDGSVEATLPVFDGVEIGVDRIHEASAHINEQVFQGWMTDNAFQSISDGYRQMLMNVDVTELTPITLKELSKALGVKKGDFLDQNTLARLGRDIQTIADKIQARKNAMASVPSRVDHMAGASSPYEHSPSGEQNLTDEGLIEVLQRREKRELKKIQDKRSEARARPTTQKPSEKAQEVAAALGTEVEGYDNVRRISGTDLSSMVTKETGASTEQQSLMQMMNRGPVKKTLKNFTVFTGSAEELNRLKQAEFGHLPDVEIEEGQAWIGSEVIFLTNVSPETVVHEALHAATYRTIKDFYDDPQSVSEEVRDAVERIRALASEFMGLKPENMPKNIRESMYRVRSAMLDKELSKAQQMSEFLSWTLANQNLIELGQKVRVRNPLALVVAKTVQALKKLLGIQSSPGKNLFENLRFNAEILARVPRAEHANQMAAETDQLLEQRYPGTNRLRNLERQYGDKLLAYLESMRDWRPEVKAKAGNTVAQARNMARTASERAIANGFAMNPREALAFEAVHSTMMSGMKLDPAMMRKATQMYRHVVSKLSTEDFLDAQGVGENPTSDQISSAAMKVDFLTGTNNLRKDREGNSDLMATFMALAQVDDTLRAVLGDMAPPKAMKVNNSTVDGFLRSLANAAVELLARLSLSRRKQSKTVQDELDRLADTLSEVQGERAYMATIHKLGATVNSFNDKAAEKLSSGTKTAVAALDKAREGTSNQKAKTALTIAKGITSLGDRDASTTTGEQLTKMMNDMPNGQALRSLLSDVRGATESNMGLLRLINLVRARIDAVRQDYREGIPRELEKRFSRELSRDEWSQLFMGLGRADLMAFKRPEVMDLLKNPKAADRKIQDLEEKIQSLGGKFGSLYLEKAEALATYMMTRKIISNNLQRNAHSIALLAGEQGTQKKAIEKIATPELMQAIEQVTSLYAFQKLDSQTTDKMTELVDTEETGMRTLIGTLQAARAKEQQRRSQQGAEGDVALKNGWQGYVPSLTAQGASVIVEDVDKEADLIRKGYVRIGMYYGDRRAGYRGKRAYYQSTVSGRNAFRQGVAQTVHESYQGVDSRTGRNKSEETGELVLGQRANEIAKDIRENGSDNNLTEGEHLLPIYDVNNNISGFEESLDPDKLVGLEKDQNLGRMLGVWLGRIEEESLAHEANRGLLETLKETYDKEYALNRDAFVNVADKKLKDPIYKDAWGTLGWKIKADAAEIFGRPDFLPIRKDMIDDAIGYRAASLTDSWTGISRLKPEHQEKIKRAAILIMGTDAYRYMKEGEKIVQGAVSYAKSTIIVRSIAVAWENILSNVAHLMAMGIDPITVAKGMRSKFLEVTQYTKNLEQIQSLKVDLAGAFDNKVRQKNLKAQIQALEDTNARLSIAPLIEAGEFSTISEDLTESDVAIREGKWADYLERATDKLPEWGQTTGKNLLMTKDSAVFQGLNRMVQYGDFIAKAIVYDHLTGKKKQTHREALDVVLEEFVQYNRLPGRIRDSLESHGLVWFFNYKLRIMKIAVKTLRDRPVSALFMFGGFGPSTGIDTVVDGSLPGTIERGTIGYAFGPMMGINAPMMHPVLDLTN